MRDLTVTFFSNYLTLHQTPFCEAMEKRLHGNFKYVATSTIPEDRLKLGYKDLSKSVNYAVNAYENEESYKLALSLGENSDVVIMGDAPITFAEKRLKEDKLTFKYTERYFKCGRWRILDPRVFAVRYKEDIKYRKNKNYRLLCASAYTGPDCRFIGCYKNKAYKWGYFPPTKTYEDIDGIIDGKKKNSILWVARFLKLKRPEHVVYVADRLKKEGYNFSVEMVGIGERAEKIKRDIIKRGLQSEVKLLGAMSPEKVRERMEQSEIFLFTSDRNEGWGAVLNESMNGGCAVVASGKIGSVPYLIQNGENGFSYKNKKDLYKKVKFLLDEPEKRKVLGKNAYQTLVGKWNAEAAADRLIRLIENVISGKDSDYPDGPCSKD